MADTEKNLSVVVDGLVNTIFNDRQFQRKSEFLHPDYVKHFHDGKPDIGIDQFVQDLEGMATQFPTIKQVVKKSIASGDHVWLWTEIEGLPEGFELEIVEICRLEGGKVREKWNVHQQKIGGGQ